MAFKQKLVVDLNQHLGFSTHQHLVDIDHGYFHYVPAAALDLVGARNAKFGSLNR
jgi:hypothetical protein